MTPGDGTDHGAWIILALLELLYDSGDSAPSEPGSR